MARRLGIVVVCVVSLVGCVGLAWWQWERFESATGSWQNLGYVLQWPLFGLFPAFVFWRLRKLRREPDTPPKAAPPPPEPWAPAPRAVGQDDDDPELAEYNRYLARLNEMDQQESR
jgi:DNA-binding transcriptional regulator of glucitol operon